MGTLFFDSMRDYDYNYGDEEFLSVKPENYPLEYLFSFKQDNSTCRVTPTFSVLEALINEIRWINEKDIGTYPLPHISDKHSFFHGTNYTELKKDLSNIIMMLDVPEEEVTRIRKNFISEIESDLKLTIENSIPSIKEKIEKGICDLLKEEVKSRLKLIIENKMESVVKKIVEEEFKHKIDNLIGEMEQVIIKKYVKEQRNG